jgi:hypothetical protein
VKLALLAPVLVLAVGSGCGSTTTTGVVPWRNRPLPLYVVPAPKPIRYPTSAPRCRARQLRAGQGRTAVGLGNRLEELVFTNVGARPCLLRGTPAISAVTAAGRRRTLRPQHGGTYFGRLVPADLAPGGHVFLDLATSRACDGGRKPAVRYLHLVFTLPGDGRIRAEHVSLTEYCGLSTSEFGLPERYAEARAAPGSAGTLHARLRLPARVRPGATLRYSVTLANPTDTTVTLRPRPGFSESFVTPQVSVRRSYALDCDSVHAIPAHGRVRYAMRVTVPRSTKPGLAKIAWSLNTPTGPFTAGLVRITRLLGMPPAAGL